MNSNIDHQGEIKNLYILQYLPNSNLSCVYQVRMCFINNFPVKKTVPRE